MALGHLPVEPTEVQGRLEQLADGGQALVLPGRLEVLLDAVEHLLGGGEAAGGLDDEDPVRGRLEHVQLAVGADVVDAGVGAGVGEEDESLVEAHGEAVGHSGP